MEYNYFLFLRSRFFMLLHCAIETLILLIMLLLMLLRMLLMMLLLMLMLVITTYSM